MLHHAYPRNTGKAKSLQSICKVQKVNWDIATALFLWFSKEHKVEVCIMKWPYVCKLNPTFVLQMLTFTDQIHSCLWVFADQLRIYTSNGCVCRPNLAFSNPTQHLHLKSKCSQTNLIVCMPNRSAHKQKPLYTLQTVSISWPTQCLRPNSSLLDWTWVFVDWIHYYPNMSICRPN